MAAARIAAVVFAVLSIPLGAQSSAHSQFSIKITDGNGFPVRSAEIEAIEYAGRIISATRTDVNGNAALDLPGGHRVYLVIPKDTAADEQLTNDIYSKHFAVPIKQFVCVDGTGWHQACTLQFNGLLEQDQPLRMIAVVGELPCTLCVTFETVIPLQHVEMAQHIPAVPMRILAPLPSKRNRTH